MLLMDVIFLWLIYNENTKLPRLRSWVLNIIPEMLKSAVEMQTGPADFYFSGKSLSGEKVCCA
jgi:hypothetical protein